MRQCKVIYTFLFFITYTKESHGANFKKYVTEADSKMQNAILTFPLGSSTACGILCDWRNDCVSYSYTTSTKTCTMYDEDPYSAPSEVVPSPGNNLYIKDCEEEWTWFVGSCYLFSMTNRGWESSKAYCESVGAKLVKVENDQEHQFIRQTAAPLKPEGTSRRYFWIGARYNYTAGEHRWIDGSEITLNGWRPGLPGTQKGCVDYLGSADWLWNAHSNCVSATGPSICKRWRLVE